MTNHPRNADHRECSIVSPLKNPPGNETLSLMVNSTRARQELYTVYWPLRQRCSPYRTLHFENAVLIRSMQVKPNAGGLRTGKTLESGEA